MNIGFHLAVLAATFSFATALAHFAISRAPGWRGARAFGTVALTATCYSLGNLVSCMDGLPFAAYSAGARWNYLFAALHVLSWYPVMFGGPDGTMRSMRLPLRGLVLADLGLTGVLLVTGWHMHAELRPTAVPWAGVVYHNLDTTPLGDVYGAVQLGLLLPPFAEVLRRHRHGERGYGWIVAGFVVFLACALVELLVANRVIVFLAPADVGFLAVVVPMSFLQLRRFIEDAGRLHALSGRLAGEVRERTEERDRAELALVEAERLAALGRLAAGVGHEINNPLTYMQLALDDVDEHLAASGASERARQSLADARDGAWRIQKVVEGLRMYSRRQDERRPLDPADVARAALKVAQPHLRHVARIESRLEPTPLVLGDEPRLVQAIVNLLTNAAQAVAERQGAGRIALAVRRCGGDVALEVEDDGAGLPEADRGRLLEPYFTTRAARGGLGLGLFVTQGIADAHGGRVEFEPLEPRGTRVRIVLPALEAGAAPAPSPARRGASPPEPRGPRPRLLVVDDEPLVLRVLSQGLASRWDVTCADGGGAAVRLLEGGVFDAVVCDLLMPGTSGMALAEHVATHHPRLRPRMVFLTGGAVTPESQAFLEAGDVSVLSKPVRLEELEARLRDTIEAR